MSTFSYVDEFAYHERVAGKAASTIRNHRAAVTALAAWVAERGKSEADAGAADLLGYLNTIIGRYSPDQVNNVISAFRVYFRWLLEEGLRDDNTDPAAKLKYVPVPLRPVESLTGAECRRLVRWASGQARRKRFGAHRSAVLAMLLLDTGLRVGEALGLHMSALNFEEGRILIRKTKTGDFRLVPLSLGLRRHLRRYLMRRQKRLAQLEVNSEFVFIGESGNQCSVSAAEQSFRRIGEAAGIRPVYPHLLRHTFATQSLLNGAPLPAVMRLGGWRKLTTVQRYTYMNDAVAAEVHGRTSPLARA